jgi:hypothetical protein
VTSTVCTTSAFARLTRRSSQTPLVPACFTKISVMVVKQRSSATGLPARRTT